MCMANKNQDFNIQNSSNPIEKENGEGPESI